MGTIKEAVKNKHRSRITHTPRQILKLLNYAYVDLFDAAPQALPQWRSLTQVMHFVHGELDEALFSLREELEYIENIFVDTVDILEDDLSSIETAAENAAERLQEDD